MDTLEKIKTEYMTYENDCIITETPNDKYVKEEAWICKLAIKQVMNLEHYIEFPVVKFLNRFRSSGM